MKFPAGYWLELIPRPRLAIRQLVWVVRIEGFDSSFLRVTDRDTGFLLRLDENDKTAVREIDRAVFEVGRIMAPDPIN
jgi:hypothetical protein